LRLVTGIELDDSSHKRVDRQARDQFVDSVFASAELPLLHFRASRTYDVRQISHRLVDVFATDEQTAPQSVQRPAAQAEPATAEAPACPKCGKPMKLRTARQGANRGNQFWGCSGYPNCHGILPFEQ
jgi:hypothetical protein